MGLELIIGGGVALLGAMVRAIAQHKPESPAYRELQIRNSCQDAIDGMYDQAEDVIRWQPGASAADSWLR